MIPNVITSTALISAYKSGKLLEQALDVLKVLLQHGAMPNLITASALVSACGKGEQPKKALEVFGEVFVQCTELVAAYSKAGLDLFPPNRLQRRNEALEHLETAFAKCNAIVLLAEQVQPADPRIVAPLLQACEDARLRP